MRRPDDRVERPHLDVIDRIIDNLRVALARLLLIEPRAALELSASLVASWWIRGRLREGIGWIEQALAAAPDAPPELRATARFAHAFLIAQDADDWEGAARSIDLGIALLAERERAAAGPRNAHVPSEASATSSRRREVGLGARRGGAGDRPPSPGGSRRLARDVLHVARRQREARQRGCGRRHRDLHRVRRDGAPQWSARRRDGRVQRCGGDLEERADLDEARRFWERTLRCRREIDAVDVGHLHGSMPLNLLAIARVAAKQGDLATASTLLREALPIAQEIRDEATARQIAELLAQTSRVEPTESATLRPEGGVWHVRSTARAFTCRT
jgi:tetratricopeptide (TPR) repeat protein